MSRWPVTVILVLVVVTCAVSARGEGLANLCPADAVLYAEVRNPRVVMEHALATIQKMTGEKDVLDKVLAEPARELGLTPKELYDEGLKVKSVAVVWHRIEPKRRGNPTGVFLFDMGEAVKLRDAIAEAMKKEAPATVATVEGIKIYGDDREDARGPFTFIDGNLLVIGDPLDEVKTTVMRLKGAREENITAMPRFRKAVAEVAADAAAFVYYDLPNYRVHAKNAWGQDRDVRTFDALLDLATVDCVFGQLNLKDGRLLMNATALMNAENRFLKAVMTKTGQRTIERAFADNFFLVHSGTLIDGKAQWQAFADCMARGFNAIERRNEFAQVMGEVETTLNTKLADELANVTEYGVGMRFRKDQEYPRPEFLFAVKVKDARRMAAFMKKVEAAAGADAGDLRILEKDVDGVKVRYLPEGQADSDHAYAIVGDVALASERLSVLEDAVRTLKGGKNILAVEDVKKAIAGLHDPNAKLLIQNMAAMPKMGRGMPVMMSGIGVATTVEQPLRIDARWDATGFTSMMGMFVGVRVTAMEDRPVPRRAVGKDVERVPAKKEAK